VTLSLKTRAYRTSETAAQENTSTYFPLLDRIAEGRFAELTTEQEIYNAFLETLKNEGFMANGETLSSFQLAAALHSAAPRIEAHYQYYNTTVESHLMVAQDAACPVWVHMSGKQYCSPTFERAQQDYIGAPYVY
jgi:UDP-glucose:glycoprotein glucosyltransferase